MGVGDGFIEFILGGDGGFIFILIVGCIKVLTKSEKDGNLVNILRVICGGLERLVLGENAFVEVDKIGVFFEFGLDFV
jgi:hypothetical protein